jgi:rare lipoprotein A
MRMRLDGGLVIAAFRQHSRGGGWPGEIVDLAGANACSRDRAAPSGAADRRDVRAIGWGGRHVTVHGRRLPWLLAVACLLGACTATPPRPAPVPPLPSAEVDGAPGGVVDREALERLPDRVPVAEPRSATGNMSPYEVFGERYEVLPESSNYIAEGFASWYGKKFHGRRTSSGEKFDMFELSGAHRSLPIPCYARVTNLANGRSTVIRINDRGPFHRGRILDVSYATAVKLGFDRTGSARVRIETLEPTTPALVATARGPDAVRYVVQAGAFRSSEAAAALRQRLAGLVEDGTLVHADKGDDDLYRVRVGPFADRAAADRVRARLAGIAAGAMILRE